MLSSVSTASLLFKFSVGRLNSATINVSHLLFVDNTTIFCANACEQMMNLQAYSYLV